MSAGSVSPRTPSSTLAPAGAADDSAARADEDRRLLVRYHREGDRSAREELVERLLPLARRMARRYRRSDEPLDDLVQVATLGLIKAMEAAGAWDAVSLESYRFGDEGDGGAYAGPIGVEDGRFELVEYGATIA